MATRKKRSFETSQDPPGEFSISPLEYADLVLRGLAGLQRAPANTLLDEGVRAKLDDALLQLVQIARTMAELGPEDILSIPIWSDLPTELWVRILAYIPDKQATTVMGLSRRFLALFWQAHPILLNTLPPLEIRTPLMRLTGFLQRHGLANFLQHLDIRRLPTSRTAHLSSDIAHLQLLTALKSLSFPWDVEWPVDPNDLISPLTRLQSLIIPCRGTPSPFPLTCLSRLPFLQTCIMPLQMFRFKWFRTLSQVVHLDLRPDLPLPILPRVPMHHFTALTNLRHLFISCSVELDSALPDLRELECTLLPGDAPESTFSGFRALEALTLLICPEPRATAATHLLPLNFFSLPHLSDLSLGTSSYFPSRLPHTLTRLSLIAEDPPAPSIAGAIRELTNLSSIELRGVLKPALVPVLSGLTNLRWLSVSNPAFHRVWDLVMRGGQPIINDDGALPPEVHMVPILTSLQDLVNAYRWCGSRGV